MLHKTALDAKVAATNAANDYANRIYPILADYFRGLVGCKVTKSDGELFKKIADGIPALPEPKDGPNRVSVYRSHSGYALRWTVKACESYPSGPLPGDCCAAYSEQSVYVAVINGSTIVRIFDFEPDRTDYTADEVKANREAYRKAKQAADAARSALEGFGEYDR